MSWDTVAGGWPIYKGRFKQSWDRLSDEDLEKTKGDRSRLSTLLQGSYGLTAEDADRRMEDWLREPGVLDDWNYRRPI